MKAYDMQYMRWKFAQKRACRAPAVKGPGLFKQARVAGWAEQETHALTRCHLYVDDLEAKQGESHRATPKMHSDYTPLCMDDGQT